MVSVGGVPARIAALDAKTGVSPGLFSVFSLFSFWPRDQVLSPLMIALAAAAALALAYRTYGRWLAQSVFRLDDDSGVPSVQQRDDQDFVPTNKSVLFGHHFTSIAGTGPIVGPALAVMWGWGPALLWVLFGSVFIGAVHDFGSLIISVRSRGQTVGDVAGTLINPRVRFLFLFVLFLALTIVLAIFGLVIASVFRQYPSSIIPCAVQIPIAIAIGSYLHRRGANLLIPSVVALLTMYVTLVFGDVGWLGDGNRTMAEWSTITWVGILLAYSYVASVLPVWLLLQPRDYINSLQLITALGLVVTGLVVAGLFGGVPLDADPASPSVRLPLELAAPMFRGDVTDAPMMFPFLFVTIACGACSGFHCLVSSGTSSKQIACESDSLPIGYGSMLVEGFLATLVILACVAGLGLGTESADGTILTGADAYQSRYASWSSANGLAVKVGAFVDGSANFLRAIGIPAATAVAIMGVLVASFAGTTLDTACRLQRYVIQELASTVVHRNGRPAAGKRHPLGWLTNKHGATLVAIALAILIAALPAPGTAVGLIDATRGTIPGDVVDSLGGAIEDGGVVPTDGGLSATGWWLSTFSGKGGMILWPLFGATNQLLAGLAFLVIVFYLRRRGSPFWFVAIPTLFMLAIPAWALITLIPQWVDAANPNYVVISFGFATVALEFWMVAEAIGVWLRGPAASQP